MANTALGPKPWEGFDLDYPSRVSQACRDLGSASTIL